MQRQSQSTGKTKGQEENVQVVHFTMWKCKQIFWDEYRDAVQGMYQGMAGAEHPLVRDTKSNKGFTARIERSGEWSSCTMEVTDKLVRKNEEKAEIFSNFLPQSSSESLFFHTS